MHIISLEVENIKKIKAAYIQPKDNVVMIQGENAVGKSSILDSITMALGGGKEVPQKPIRDGADKGGIKMEFTDFTVIRTFTSKGSYLRIETKEGNTVKSPQEFLDKLVGKVSFDPLEFINQDEKKQRKVLMELIGVDVDALDKKEKEVYDERAIKGRELKAQETKVKGMGKVDSNAPEEEVKLSDLVQVLEEANKRNKEIEDKKLMMIALRESAVNDENQIKIYETSIAELKSKILDKKAQFKLIKNELADIEPEDTDQIKQVIDEAEKTNAKVRQNKLIRQETADYNNIKSEYDKAESRLKGVRDERIKSLADANIPVDGLTFEGDGLSYNGIPLKQCSDGEKLMISMGISMALNPEIRVLRIKDGSLLGKKNLQILSDLVHGKDFQLWIERVSDKDQYNATGKVGILIEEGEVIYVDGEEIDKKVEKKNKKESGKDDGKKVENKVETKELDDDWEN